MPGIALFFTMGSFAQDYSSVQFNVQNGLAGSPVYDAVKDKDGFLWLAPEVGISGFGGTNFRNYTSNDGMADDEVLKLFVDSKKRVWMIPFKQTVFYYNNGEIHTQENDSQLSQLHITSEILNIKEGDRSEIIIQELSCLHLITNN